MIENLDDEIGAFIKLAEEKGVEMLMIGGGAVNFHGYQRHSADVDFWIDISEENLDKLLQVFKDIGYDIEEIPKKVRDGEQNISLKFSPVGLYVELITHFSINKSFQEAYKDSEIVEIKRGDHLLKWHVINFEDLITSKIKSGRPKDMLDIQALKRIKGEK